MKNGIWFMDKINILVAKNTQHVQHTNKRSFEPHITNLI